MTLALLVTAAVPAGYAQSSTDSISTAHWESGSRFISADFSREDNTGAYSEGSQPPQRQRGGQPSRRIYKSTITPHWFADNTRFWYRNDLRGGKREFIVVDTKKGTRKSAFDHARLANSLRDTGVSNARADRLPIERLRFDTKNRVLRFWLNNATWQCDLGSYEVQQLDEKWENDRSDAASPLKFVPRASTRTGDETFLTFVNKTATEVELFWLDGNGQRRSYGNISPDKEHRQHTYAGHLWEIVDRQGTLLVAFEAQSLPLRAEITGRVETTGKKESRSKPNDRSPDGQWTAFISDNNVFVRSSNDSTEVRLSSDGESGNGYGLLRWTPDSRVLVAFRIEPGADKKVHLIESSPKGGGRAKLLSHVYPLPGDRFTSYELNLFDVTQKKQIKPEVERIDFGRPRLRWNCDGHRFSYTKVDRGHQRFRLIEVDWISGAARTAIDEATDTFIWTAHRPESQPITYLDHSDEAIYLSERDGWRHLYLVDLKAGRVAHQITKGDWLVRSIERIDEETRRIWFRASGIKPNQDPYLVHVGRVNFDGSELVFLTEGNGNHSIQFSPDGDTIIDRYSRVDLPPVHTLRAASDGRLICELEQADISELRESKWQPPEVFHTKGRDGKTDIWGIICRPPKLDPKKKYPIIEDIYAGPHGSHVPKSFNSTGRYGELTDLGFIVVKIDGMGTANRSKKFHDVCWHNLKDAGLPDRIAWIKSAAAKYPYMDTTRVGIYGTSAGGQNAAGAVLFHPEFYQAAVASCGCHDNRMDKASWNEQWMGYPVGPAYAASSNVDNAHRLQGRLMLIVGELDRNVPPESTMRFADALIKANKDFDLLVIPGSGHSDGGSYGRRRMHDFFLKHLQNVESSNQNTN